LGIHYKVRRMGGMGRRTCDQAAEKSLSDQALKKLEQKLKSRKCACFLATIIDAQARKRLLSF